MRTKNINSLLWRGYDVPESVKAEINLLFNMSVNELRAKYREVFGYNMNSRNKDFLLRKIAWKLQANLFGDIPEELKIRAIESVDFSRLKVRDTAKTVSADFEKTGFVERRMETARDRRLPMPGSILAKNYNGKKSPSGYWKRDSSSTTNITLRCPALRGRLRERTGTDSNFSNYEKSNSAKENKVRHIHA